MGAIYKFRAWGGKRGRYIYNRERLHKVGFYPFPKTKELILRKEFQKIKSQLINKSLDEIKDS